VVYVNVYAYQLLSLNGANPLQSYYGHAPTGRNRPKYLSSPVHHTSHRNRTLIESNICNFITDFNIFLHAYWKWIVNITCQQKFMMLALKFRDLTFFVLILIIFYLL
jgi:hypothetical protein